jgi:1-acyl-sn-glycerol-3-phosphate acyltransferase
MNDLIVKTITNTIKGLGILLCRIEAEEIEMVPKSGPLILVTNHINFLDIPLVYTHLTPRSVTGFIKIETWDNPVLAPLFSMWGAIPIRRGQVDVQAFHRGLQALAEKKIVAIAPEGTRSGDGRLRYGHPGVVPLAIHSNAPILPLVMYGAETFHHNIRRLRRTDFRIRVGKLMTIDVGGEKIDRHLRRKIADEIMYELATLLPEQYRGAYYSPRITHSRYLRYSLN